MKEIDFYEPAAGIVRRYTSEERNAMNETTTSLEKIVTRTRIDEERYTDAMSIHPAMTEHFNRLINVGKRAVVAWTDYYTPEQAVTSGVCLPYAGTESSADVARPAEVPNHQRAHLPA